MSRKRQKKIGSFDVGGISPTTTKLQLNNTNTTTFNHNLLHSDKSTYTTNSSIASTSSNAYFYNNIKHKCKLSLRFSDWLKSVHYSINELRWTSRNRALDKAVIPTQSSRKTSSYDRIAGRQKNIIPLMFSALALLVVVSMLVCPIGGDMLGLSGVEAYAAEASSDGNVFRPADYARISFSIQNTQDDGNTVEVSNDGTVTTNVKGGIVSYINNEISISTSNIDQFFVGIQAAEGSTSELVGTTSRATIAGVGENVDPDNFPMDTWGYALTDTTSSNVTYSTLPTYNSTDSPIQYSSSTNLADSDYKLRLSFAAKISASKPADHYTTKALVSIAANPKSITLSNIDYMQDITTDICTNSDLHETKQLIDKRDNKSYWVTKLKDGNCWMTQNLDLDLNGRTLTTADSDVTSDWISTTGASALWSTTGANDVKFYDPGNKYCTGSNCNATSSSNNGHDHQGNYYSFNAATAGTGQSATTQNTNAASSICPKGWQLPTSNSTSSKSFVTLAKTYEIDNNKAGSTALRSSPLYFIRSGNVRSSGISGEGSYGFYWSSTANSPIYAYGLNLSSSNVYPSNNNDRYPGFCIRCVAR